MEDKTLRMTLLFDFYGNLLTEKQREYFDLYHNEDLSLAEIAENEGITRQGVRDIIQRAENILADTEEKTGLIRKFQEIQVSAAAIDKLLAGIPSITDQAELLEQIGKIEQAAAESERIGMADGI